MQSHSRLANAVPAAMTKTVSGVRLAVLLSLLMLGAPPVVAPAQGVAPAQAPESSTAVSVSAQQPWVDTAVDLNACEALTISANGQWSNGGNPPYFAGPDGFEKVKLQEATLKSANFAALIGKVGDKVFFVGSAYNGTSPAAGRLYLQINDIANATCFADNSGKLDVEVRHPAAVSLPPRAPFQDPLNNGAKGPAMIKVPAGTFNMGEAGSSHSVTIAKPFAIGVYEVTFEDYDQFAKATGRAMPSDQGWGRERRPVINVNWDDARAYAVWLSAQTGARYRLPSEAEWEYACRAGSTTRFSFGDDAACAGAFAWYNGNSDSKTHPVGQKRPNAFGLYDMHGNVVEWVEDCWHDSYAGAPTDGSAWRDSGACSHVGRGGCWAHDALIAYSSGRWGLGSSIYQNVDLGFRLARDL